MMKFRLASLTLSDGGHVKTLCDVEFLQFDDGTIATSAIPEPGTIPLLSVALAAAMIPRWRRTP